MIYGAYFSEQGMQRIDQRQQYTEGHQHVVVLPSADNHVVWKTTPYPRIWRRVQEGSPAHAWEQIDGASTPQVTQPANWQDEQQNWTGISHSGHLPTTGLQVSVFLLDPWKFEKDISLPRQSTEWNDSTFLHQVISNLPLLILKDGHLRFLHPQERFTTEDHPR